jgi:hypothetical protein
MPRKPKPARPCRRCTALQAEVAELKAKVEWLNTFAARINHLWGDTLEDLRERNAILQKFSRYDGDTWRKIEGLKGLGCSDSVIAEVLGITTAAIRSMRHRRKPKR